MPFSRSSKGYQNRWLSKWQVLETFKTCNFGAQVWVFFLGNQGEEGKHRHRPKGVFGKAVGNSKNASEMRQKSVKMGLLILGKEERPKYLRNPSKLRQKCVKNARNTLRGENTFWTIPKTLHVLELPNILLSDIGDQPIEE